MNSDQKLPVLYAQNGMLRITKRNMLRITKKKTEEEKSGAEEEEAARPGLGLLRITRAAAGDSDEEETLQAALGAWNLQRLRMNRLAKRRSSGAEHGDKEAAPAPWSQWSLDPRHWRSMGMNR